jgi:5-formyltetrahydrofolate cyclo-ligase
MLSLTLCMLGLYREALGNEHLPALNLRFKGCASSGILGSILIL